MLRFIDLSNDYWTDLECGFPICAFLSTRDDKFLLSVDGCHTFSCKDDILEHAQGPRMLGLVPNGFFTRYATQIPRMNGNMNQALENLTVRNLQLEAEVAGLKAERLGIRSQLKRAEETAEMWKKEIQKYAGSRLRAEEYRNTEMQRKHVAEKNLAHSGGWAAGFKAAEVMNTREKKQMHRSELREVEKALKARRLRREDPMVYMVKMFRSNDTTAYMTQCPSHGLSQFFAQDLEHIHLRLFSSREDAEIACEIVVTGDMWMANTYKVVEMPKQDIYSLSFTPSTFKTLNIERPI